MKDPNVAERALPKINTLYQHYKGNIYLVLGFATHTETGERLVLYKGIKESLCNDYWVRPLNMWFDEIEEGIFRFSEVEMAQ